MNKDMAELEAKMAARRQTRAQEIAAGRRRRSPDANMNGMFLRLGVDPAEKDPNYEYRWINDDKGRLQALTQQDDWDFVENHAVAADGRNLNESESRIRRVVDRTASGEPMYAFLCRKYKPWYDDDQAARTALDDTKRQTLTGNVPAEERDNMYGEVVGVQPNRVRRSQKG